MKYENMNIFDIASIISELASSQCLRIKIGEKEAVLNHLSVRNGCIFIQCPYLESLLSEFDKKKSLKNEGS